LRLADVIGTRTGGAIIPVNRDNGEPLDTPGGFIRSNITKISASRDDATYNYPNPFNPAKQNTNIVYYSTNQGTTTIKIFTITGRIVRTMSDAAVIGSNEAVWDGKNGRGQIVRNGVYVAVIMTPDGSKQMVKIAVVK
jgi:flagellar hook assembly protein FlgD